MAHRRTVSEAHPRFHQQSASARRAVEYFVDSSAENKLNNAAEAIKELRGALGEAEGIIEQYLYEEYRRESSKPKPTNYPTGERIP